MAEPPTARESADPDQRPSLAAVASYFLRLGATGFGGPVTLADYMRRDWVERRAWMTGPEFDEGLAIATACPGPLAYQLGIYCGFLSRGVSGAIAAALAFGLPPFILVACAAALYQRYTDSGMLRALFYGIGPVVVGLILRSAWSLSVKTIGRDAIAIGIAVIACLVTAIWQREPTLVLVAAGLFGIAVFGRTPPSETTGQRRRSTSAACVIAVAPAIGLATKASAATLFWFFFRTGLLVFGSGLVIVPFLRSYLVDDFHWLTPHQFVDAVSIGMISPGPVVISATFVGYLLASMPGAIAATIGIFLPSLLFVVVGTPLLRRYRSAPPLRGFVRGITTAVCGVLVGTVYLVGKSVIGDALTVSLALAALFAPLVFKKVPDQALVAAGALAGIAGYFTLHPAWMR